MSGPQRVKRIDLTVPSDALTWVEILTPGGIVRVNTNLVTTQTGQPTVVVEVERQVPGRPGRFYAGAHAEPSGEWGVDVVRFGDLRIDVVLTREPDGPDQ